ncbi:MAG: LuxR C-terminal-related transcriptional regulator [Oscillospiraceae bacterium]|nr:LuxR C-terminal-related transcriptional regulator [Oscillospiraceae bacterium]
MEYLSVNQTAKKWGVSIRWVQKLLLDGRIEGASRVGRDYIIPADAKKPGNLRKSRSERSEAKENFNSKTNELLSDDLDRVCEATIKPFPHDNPDAVMETVNEERLRLQFKGELAYLRGDFEKVIRCFRDIGDDDAAKLRACPLTIAAAISTGDFMLFQEIETYCKNIVQSDLGANVTAVAELALATAYVSAFAPDMVPDWLKNGDFSNLPANGKLDAAFKRAKYYQNTNNYELMLAVAQTALALSDSKHGLMYAGIYLRAICATANVALGRMDEARRYLSDALRLALRHGFITPFAEGLTHYGGLLEKLLEQDYPEYYNAVINQWKNTYGNWIAFHNQFTKKNVRSILTFREFEIAYIAAQGVPIKKIAEHFNVSVGTLNNNMQIIYQKLLINGKKELHEYII